MRYAIVSDIHANIQAWDAVLKDIQKQGADAILCLGDVVGYGPNPAEVLDSCYKHVDHFILGNHDAVIGNRMSSDLFNDNAKYMIEWTRDQLSDASEKFFSEMPLVMEGNNFACAHAELAMPGRFSYLMSEMDCRSSFESNDHQIMFVGHTHRPAKFVCRENSLEMAPMGDFYVQGIERYLVNVGSVGDPRDGSTAANYCLYDENDMFIRNRQVPFDIQSFKRNLLKASLPVKPYFINVSEGQKKETATIIDMKVPEKEYVQAEDKIHYVQQDNLDETRTRRLQRRINFSSSKMNNFKKSRSTNKNSSKKSRSRKTKKASPPPALILSLLIVALATIFVIFLNQNKSHSTSKVVKKKKVQEEPSVVVEKVALGSPSESENKSVKPLSDKTVATKGESSQEALATTTSSNSSSTLVSSTVLASPEPAPQFNLGHDESGLKIKLSQTTNKGQGITRVDLSSHGNLDWAAWDGGRLLPKQKMSSGKGFNDFTGIGTTTFEDGSFYSQNNYSWHDGVSNKVSSSSLAGRANTINIGDGIRLKVDVESSGKYQLKFYVSTYDVNLSARAYLSSGAVAQNSNGNYVSDSVEKYEYTVNFSTDGADTLTLDLVKSDGLHPIVAPEAFSLNAVGFD